MNATNSDWFSGLDLGQSADFSALVIVERTYVPDPHRPGSLVPHFAIRHVHRWPLLTRYPAIVDDVKTLVSRPPLYRVEKMRRPDGSIRSVNVPSTLVIDETGVGRPVVDMVRAANIPAIIKPYTITGGESPGAAGNTVPKKNLVGAIQVPLQAGRLKIAPGLMLADTLAKELELFRVKVTTNREEQYAAWRERDHDDLVLALALALFVAQVPPLECRTMDVPTTDRVDMRTVGLEGMK